MIKRRYNIDSMTKGLVLSNVIIINIESVSHLARSSCM